MKRFALLVTGTLLLAIMSPGLDGAVADSKTIDFESPYAPGSIEGQQGWTGSGIPINPLIDQEVKAHSPGVPSGFGSQSFRMSNAYTDSAFAGWPFSPSLNDEAGEAGAISGGFSGGTRQAHFEAQWNFASATGSLQAGLQISVSPDRGDGARMSFIRMTDSSTGLGVDFVDYQDNAPFGSAGSEALGCGSEDGFVTTSVATGLSRTVPHTVKLTMDLVDGPRNDIVRVYVDGTLRHTGTSWEDSFRWCEATDESRTVDSLIFQARTASGQAALTLGNGFLFDNLSYSSGPIPAPSADLSVSKTDSPDPAHVGQKLTYTIPVVNNGPDAATGVSLVDNLPKNAGFGSASSTQGSCTVKPEKRLVSCSLGTLASGQTATVTIVVKPTKKGTITNTVSVTATSPTDPNTANNTATQNTTVVP